MKGFGVNYVDNASKVRSINFDVISSDLSHSAYSAVRGMRLLREQAFFKEIVKPEYVLWFDKGKHLWNNKILGYFLSELKKENIHGKL